MLTCASPLVVEQSLNETKSEIAETSQTRTIQAFRLRELGPLLLYRFVALVKVLLERLRRAIRALAGSALHLDNAHFAISGS